MPLSFTFTVLVVVGGNLPIGIFLQQLNLNCVQPESTENYKESTNFLHNQSHHSITVTTDAL